MLLRVVDDGQFRDIHINEGEMFLLPGTYSTPRARCGLSYLGVSDSEHPAQSCQIQGHDWTRDGTCASRGLAWCVCSLRSHPVY